MILNPITEKWMSAYISKPSVALLIDCSGDLLTGKEISRQIYDSLVPENNNPPVTINLGDKKSIGVEDIRDFKKSLSLRANRKDGISRYIEIEDASKLTVEAQNSLLKIVEELPNNTLIVLIVSDSTTIIQTVKSRCFTLPVLPVSVKQALKYAEEHSVDEDLALKMYSLSEGKSSIYISLLNNEIADSIQEIEMAKEFLRGSVVERQNIIEKVSQKDYDSLSFIRALKITAKAGMYHSKTNLSANNWKEILKNIIQTEEQLKQNVTTKLALLSLSVSI
jgi:DNA polymerase III delta prime subunit